MSNTVKVIYAWDKKILSFSKNSKFCKQEMYENDHIIDIHGQHRNVDYWACDTYKAAKGLI